MSSASKVKRTRSRSPVPRYRSRSPARSAAETAAAAAAAVAAASAAAAAASAASAAARAAAAAQSSQARAHECLGALKARFPTVWAALPRRADGTLNEAGLRFFGQSRWPREWRVASSAIEDVCAALLIRAQQDALAAQQAAYEEERAQLYRHLGERPGGTGMLSGGRQKKRYGARI